MSIAARAQSYFIPDIAQSDEFTASRHRLVLNASLSTSLFSFSYLLISLVIDFAPGVYLMIFNVAGYLLLPYLLKWRVPVMAVGNLYVLIGAAAVLILIYFSGGMDSPILPWLIAPPVLALLVVNQRYAVVWTVVSLCALTAIAILTNNGFTFSVQYDTSWKLPFSFLCTFGIVLIVVVIAMIFERDMRQAMQALADRNTEILEKNHELHTQKEEITIISEQLKALNDKKDDLMHIIAHDLKSPFANIQAIVRLCQMPNRSNFSDEEAITMIGDIASQSQDLIQKLLNSENFQQIAYTVKLEEVDVAVVINDVMKSLHNQATGKGVIMAFTPEKGLNHHAVVDKIYLAQIIENLIGNAIKFSLSGKSVVIDLHPNEYSIKMEIRDEGPGIKQEEMGLLFKKFSRLSNLPTAGESSSGLGLSIVKHYVELLNGRVWCESEYGKGSSFIVELPRKR